MTLARLRVKGIYKYINYSCWTRDIISYKILLVAENICGAINYIFLLMLLYVRMFLAGLATNILRNDIVTNYISFPVSIFCIFLSNVLKLA